MWKKASAIMLCLFCLIVLTPMVGRTERVYASASQTIRHIKTATSRVETAQDVVFSENLKNTHVVLIGDSYLRGMTPEGYIKGWGERLTKELELQHVDSFGQVGAGFLRPANGYTFLTLLDKAGQEVMNKDDVEYLLLCGGYNDVLQDMTKLEDAMESFHTRAKELFPNATLLYCMAGWNRNDDKVQKNLNLYIRPYMMHQAEIHDDIYYLENADTILLKDAESYFASDDMHPSEMGQKALSRSLAIEFWKAHQMLQRQEMAEKMTEKQEGWLKAQMLEKRELVLEK